MNVWLLTYWMQFTSLHLSFFYTFCPLFDHFQLWLCQVGCCVLTHPSLRAFDNFFAFQFNIFTLPAPDLKFDFSLKIPGCFQWVGKETWEMKLLLCFGSQMHQVLCTQKAKYLLYLRQSQRQSCFPLEEQWGTNINLRVKQTNKQKTVQSPGQLRLFPHL